MVKGNGFCPQGNCGLQDFHTPPGHCSTNCRFPQKARVWGTSPENLQRAPEHISYKKIFPHSDPKEECESCQVMEKHWDRGECVLGGVKNACSPGLAISLLESICHVLKGVVGQIACLADCIVVKQTSQSAQAALSSPPLAKIALSYTISLYHVLSSYSHGQKRHWDFTHYLSDRKSLFSVNFCVTINQSRSLNGSGF